MRTMSGATTLCTKTDMGNMGETTVGALKVARARRAAKERRGGPNAEDWAKGGGEVEANRDDPR
jgi:hypothetical protein